MEALLVQQEVYGTIDSNDLPKKGTEATRKR